MHYVPCRKRLRYRVDSAHIVRRRDRRIRRRLVAVQPLRWRDLSGQRRPDELRRLRDRWLLPTIRSYGPAVPRGLRHQQPHRCHGLHKLRFGYILRGKHQPLQSVRGGSVLLFGCSDVHQLLRWSIHGGPRYGELHGLRGWAVQRPGGCPGMHGMSSGVVPARLAAVAVPEVCTGYVQ